MSDKVYCKECGKETDWAGYCCGHYHDKPGIKRKWDFKSKSMIITKEEEKKEKPHRKIPRLVRALCFECCDAWIVGKGADYAAGKTDVEPTDFDVVVAAKYWSKACHICINAESITVNSFGGFKCESDGKLVDVWMDDVAELMSHGTNESAFHPRTKTYISREKL